MGNRLLHVSRTRVKCLHLLRRWVSKLVLLREPRLQYHSTKETRPNCTNTDSTLYLVPSDPYVHDPRALDEGGGGEDGSWRDQHARRGNPLVRLVQEGHVGELALLGGGACQISSRSPVAVLRIF